MKQVADFLWLPDGRLIYSVEAPESTFNSACDFWEMRLDRRTGQPSGKPRRITHWSESCMSYISVTADAKKLVFLRSAGHATSYMADLVAGGTRILQPKHFPQSESSDAIADWAPDGKSVILISNRSGNYGLYRQFLDKDTAESLVTQGYDRGAIMSPDGKSVLYFGTGENGPWPTKGPEPVMSVSVSGGASQRLFTASWQSLLTCARSPSGLCAIGEPTEDQKQLIVSSFDPVKGRGSELFRFALGSAGDHWGLSLSPDGTRFAALRSKAGPIYIFSLRGEVLREVTVKRWSQLQSSTWAADGKSLFVTADTRTGGVALHVDLQGNADVLWENPGLSWETLAHPSPDGRYLEFDRWTITGNMWVMENF
jgi:Tol biopolymer transport system component